MTQEQIHILLTSRGFQIVPQAVMPEGRTLGPHLVYGKLIKPRLTLRVLVWNRGPMLLMFVRRQEGNIYKIGSERWVKTFELDKALENASAQMEKIDPTCNKCQGHGTFVLMQHGKRVGVKCNRCNGKGWQDWNDRIRNLRYDHAIRHRIEKTGMNATELLPCWRPYNSVQQQLELPFGR